MRNRIAVPLFVILAVVHTWPMLPQAASHILDPIDSLLSSWLLAAISRSLVAHPLSFVNVYAYYPYRQVLGTLDHQLSAVIFAGPRRPFDVGDIRGRPFFFVCHCPVLRMPLRHLENGCGVRDVPPFLL